MTSAYCLSNRTMNSLQIMVGTSDYQNPSYSRYGSTYPVIEILIHPEFHYDALINNIAMARVPFMQFNPAVQAVCLPLRYFCCRYLQLPEFFLYSYNNIETVFSHPLLMKWSERFQLGEYFTSIEVAGYGETSFMGPLSSKLKMVTLNLINNRDCAEAYPNIITKDHVCTKTAGKDACSVSILVMLIIRTKMQQSWEQQRKNTFEFNVNCIFAGW